EKVVIEAGKTTTLPDIVLKSAGIKFESRIITSAEDNIQPGVSNSHQSISMNMGSGKGAYPGSQYEAFLPPGFNTEEYDAITPNIFHSPFVQPLSTFSIDVDTATYSNIRRMLNGGQLPQANAIRTEELLNYFSYDYPQPKGELPFSVYTEMGVNPWNQKRNLVHIGIQGKKMDMDKAPPSNLVFLLDVSGSMEAYNKLPLVRQSMKLLVENLRPNDRVAIVVYAGAAGLVLPPTSGEEKGKILAAIDNLSAGGSTAGGAGIMLAYKTAEESFVKGGNNRIILCTDGDFNIGVSSTADMQALIEKNRNKGIFLTVLGYGMGNYKDNRLETLADKGNGNYAYIDDINEAKKVLVNEMGATLFTIAKDVKIQVEFNPAHVKAYRLIGYENRMLRSEDFIDDTKDAGELGAGHSVTAIYEIIPAGSKESFAYLDSLKYQSFTVSEEAKKSPELMTVKLRYKQPDKDESVEIATPVYNKTLGMEDVSQTFLFAASVAAYAMMLQNSEHKGALTWDMVGKLAKDNMGADAEGYRKEFLVLIKKAAKLSKNTRPD
ncbi:MAG: VWA domain-containing protein, partial [Candidatus Cloacimonadaceae bacterium]|nr:VWA domain-containing protein [Candidatus Cloacimonadaceae bacterium]